MLRRAWSTAPRSVPRPSSSPARLAGQNSRTAAHRDTRSTCPRCRSCGSRARRQQPLARPRQCCNHRIRCAGGHEEPRLLGELDAVAKLGEARHVGQRSEPALAPICQHSQLAGLHLLHNGGRPRGERVDLSTEQPDDSAWPDRSARARAQRETAAGPTCSRRRAGTNGVSPCDRRRLHRGVGVVMNAFALAVTSRAGSPADQVFKVLPDRIHPAVLVERAMPSAARSSIGSRMRSSAPQHSGGDRSPQNP